MNKGTQYYEAVDIKLQDSQPVDLGLRAPQAFKGQDSKELGNHNHVTDFLIKQFHQSRKDFAIATSSVCSLFTSDRTLFSGTISCY